MEYIKFRLINFALSYNLKQLFLNELIFIKC